MNTSRSPTYRRILIVDDADDARGVLAIALRTISGVTVETMNNAEDALLSMGNAVVDVLITDVRMTGMSGFDLLKKLRENGRWPLCGAVVTSGDTDPELPRLARACGAAAFFRKPFSAGAVRRSVVSMLEDRDDSV